MRAEMRQHITRAPSEYARLLHVDALTFDPGSLRFVVDKHGGDRVILGSDYPFGLGDDAWVLDELRELAGILGVARDAEVLAERYERDLGALPPELVRGPVRERLVGGARRRYQVGLRRSLIAMRSQRYFRLLDSLDAIAARRPGLPGAEEQAPVTIDTAYRKVRKAAKKVATKVGPKKKAAKSVRKAARKSAKKAPKKTTKAAKAKKKAKAKKARR